MPNMINMLIHPVTVEATAVCKGVEMTHGNSFHYLTFELDSGERVYFQVSIKCYMMIVEGDRCLITYRDHRNSSKKKLKSFERIAKVVPASVTMRELETELEFEQDKELEPESKSVVESVAETFFEYVEEEDEL